MPEYRPAHVKADCTCTCHVFESVNNQPITTRVSQGQVPLVQVLPRSIEIVNFNSNISNAPPYVAISHIRSQGLGNTSSNSLFTCQLERLQGLVNALYTEVLSPIPFWIDTACIPLTQPGKASALELLELVYRRADIVLALDSTIQETLTLSAREDFKMIQQSVWIQRLWTVCEGALGPTVKFQFENAAVDFDDILQQCSTLPDIPPVIWTVSPDDPQRIRGKRSLDELALLDVLCMFEYDLRIYLGLAPGTQPNSSRKIHKAELRRLLRTGYLSTSRYHGFQNSEIDLEERGIARRILLDVYAGYTYNNLVVQQPKDFGQVFKRIAKIRFAK